MGNRQALEKHDAHRPGPGSPEHQGRPQGRGGDAGGTLRQEQGHPGYAQSRGHQTAAGEGFAEPTGREQHAPHRHGVAEQGRPSRGQQGNPVDGQDVPAGDVGQGQPAQGLPAAGGYLHRPAAEPGQAEDAQSPQGQAKAAKAQGRYLAQHHLHHRPVESPAQGQGGEKQQPEGGKVLGRAFGRGRHEGLGKKTGGKDSGIGEPGGCSVFRPPHPGKNPVCRPSPRANMDFYTFNQLVTKQHILARPVQIERGNLAASGVGKNE